MTRYMIRYSKQGPARYMSHLDLMRELERAMRRAGLPVAFSEGFNPHPRLSVAAPLPVGTEGLAELAEVEVTRELDAAAAVQAVNAVLPRGLQVREIRELPAGAPALMAALEKAAYIVRLDAEDLPSPLPGNALADFMALEKVEVKRRGKDGREKTRDIKPGIIKMDILPGEDGLTMRMELSTGSAMNVRPVEVAVAFLTFAGLAVDPADVQVTRTALYLAGDGLPGGKKD